MPLRPGDHVHLTLTSDPRHFRLIRGIVETFALEAGLPEARARGLAAAVDEACANVVRHAYQGRCDGSLDLRCELTPGAGGEQDTVLAVCISDRGAPPPAGRLPEPRPAASADPANGAPLRPGGLGLALMHHHADAVTFAAGPDGCNVLRLEVRCAGDARSPVAQPR